MPLATDGQDGDGLQNALSFNSIRILPPRHKNARDIAPFTCIMMFLFLFFSRVAMTVICEKASSNTLRQHNNKRRLAMIGVSYLRHLKSERCSKVGVA